jgi:hypothetical protein
VTDTGPGPADPLVGLLPPDPRPRPTSGHGDGHRPGRAKADGVSFTGAADGILVECLAVERPAKKHAQRSLADHGEVDHRAHSIGVLLGKGQDLTEHLGLHTGLLIGLGRGPC